MLLRRPRIGPLLPVAALVASIALVIAVLPGDEIAERSLSPPAAQPVPASMLGTFGPANGGPQLVVTGTSMRMIGGAPGTSTLLLGFVQVSGDRITVRVDPDRVGADPFPGPLCRGGRVGDTGTYRFDADGADLVFRLVEDPCRGRARFLTGSRWRRVR